MKIRLSSDITFDSIVDGPGLRMVIWTQGCIHGCIGCHNAQTHNLYGGYEIDIDIIINYIKTLKLQRGITLLGGEPFLQQEPLQRIARQAKKCNLDVWAYTGYTFEELIDKDNPSYLKKGGEPFLQQEPLQRIARQAKKCNLDVWAYTGYTFEELIDKDNPSYLKNLKLLNEIDVLVDGKFIESKKDISLRFRGSSNQRIIDVPKSLEYKTVFLNEEYMDEALCSVR